MEYSEEYISELINIEKVIKDAPFRDMKLERGMYKNNFTLKSKDDKYDFRVFMRINEKFQENFSVGLDYNPKDEKGTIPLVRMNGQHGENNVQPHHNTFHIHKASAYSINNNLKPERNIIETTEYASYEEALQYFLVYINLNTSDKDKFFQAPQQSLFD